jgi:hypothetical protein
MIGKGFEKIASTVQNEIYALESEGDCRTRLYETVMNESILNYSKALAEAQKAEQSSGGADKTHTGGSSHGALECLYTACFKIQSIAFCYPTCPVTLISNRKC